MRTLIALATAALAITAAPVAAGSGHQTDFSLEIEHDDLDLTSKRGVALLDARIQSAIRAKCANGGRDLASIRLERACRATATQAVRAQVRMAIATANADKVRLASRTAPAVEG